MTKPALVYAGHSYHRTTSSTVFFLELLQQHFQVAVLWDESWTVGGAPISAKQINALAPEVVVFFQTLPSRRELRRIRCKKLFLIPMHDHLVGNPAENWARIRDSGLRIINFCRATHEYFASRHFQSLLVQYWPSVQRREIDSIPGLRVFFWIRKANLGWPMLKKLLGGSRPERIVLRVSPDPGEALELPTAQEIDEFRIELIEGWMDRSRYLELLQQCNVFVAPRQFEGIGMSFLEAMSLGMLVVAPNHPTMNEYLRHGYNGLLYAFQSPSPLEFARMDDMRRQVLSDVVAGAESWNKDRRRIIDYLLSPARGPTLTWRLRGLLGR